MRKKLIELLEREDCPLFMVYGDSVEALANYLIAKGVTIPVRCTDCEHYRQYANSHASEYASWGKCKLISMDVDMPVNGYCCFAERINKDESAERDCGSGEKI